MTGFSTELKVGLFVVVSVVLVMGGYLWSFDGVRRGESAYTLFSVSYTHLTLPTICSV